MPLGTNLLDLEIIGPALHLQLAPFLIDTFYQFKGPTEDARWTRPEGGFFIWVQLADGLSTRQLLQAALSEKVAFVPGDPFFAAGGGQDNTLRLSFSTATVESIQEGFARLARAVRVVA